MRRFLFGVICTPVIDGGGGAVAAGLDRASIGWMASFSRRVFTIRHFRSGWVGVSADQERRKERERERERERDQERMNGRKKEERCP